MKNALYQLKSCEKVVIPFLFYQTEKERQMMSYIATDELGNVVVIDGGQAFNKEYLIKTLQEITGAKKPVIKAWFLTHAHSDHIEAFLSVVEDENERVEIENVYYHFPKESFIESYEPSESYTVKAFYKALPLFEKKARVINAGERISIGKMHFEILQVFDESETVNAINNSSTVFRLTVNGKKILFLGDAGIEAGNRLLKSYKSALKSDICQMAHHGQRGVTKEVYEAISPSVCLWDTPDWLWENDAGKGYNTHVFLTVEVRRWMQEMGVKTHYCTKDGTNVLYL